MFGLGGLPRPPPSPPTQNSPQTRITHLESEGKDTWTREANKNPDEPNRTHLFNSMLARPPDILPPLPKRIPRASAPALPATNPKSTKASTTLPVAKAKARRPRKGNEIEHNSLRPPVLAKDRIREWKTPFGIEADAEFRAKFPEAVVERTYATIHSAFADNTTSTYGAGPLRFTQFCDKHLIPETDRMPASPLLLSAFIAEHVGDVGGGTVKQWMSGVRAWHDENRAPWYGGERWVEMARKTAFKMGTAHKKEPRAPVTIDHLKSLRRSLDLEKPFDAAIWAAATAAFWGCRRLGEVTVPSAAKYDPKIHVSRNTHILRARVSSGRPGTVVDIPWTKSTREKGGKIFLSDRDDELCPEKARQNHLRVNQDVPGDAPYFAFASGDGKWSPLVKEHFMRRCNAIWKADGMLKVAGHSFRIGGSTELLMSGVPCEVVATTGGWSSLAFLLYWRRLEHIVLMHIGKAYSRQRVQELNSEMESFRLQNQIPLADLETNEQLDV
ncbi:hypothetical protein MKEN_00135700 [Mycena kentingensis (nom. inval.)]|nr:hypothetical protein MKEN_00135700 [Mycena kentingensis (nom. inval.)]